MRQGRFLSPYVHLGMYCQRYSVVGTASELLVQPVAQMMLVKRARSRALRRGKSQLFYAYIRSACELVGLGSKVVRKTSTWRVI